MRKAFSWSWIINGLVIGIVVIGIFYGVLGKMFSESTRQDAREALSDVYIAANSMCESTNDDETFMEIEVPDIVEGIYASEEDDLFPDDFEALADAEEIESGHYVCMKMKDEEPSCRLLDCEIDMQYIRTKETVMTLADRIMNKPAYQKFELHVFKNDMGAKIEIAE